VLTLPPAWAMLAACDALDLGPEAGCGAVYDAVTADLGAAFDATGTTAPFPDRSAFVARCAALGLSRAELACLVPATAIADPVGCRTTLDPVRPEVDELATWFSETPSPGAHP
jgi:hypothetical protein